MMLILFIASKNDYLNLLKRIPPTSKIKQYNPHYLARISLFKILPQKENGIFFIGSSKTEYCEWAELLENSKIQNRGIGSDTTDGILMRINQIINSNPEKIFIMIGANDLRANKTISNIVENYTRIIKIIKINSPETSIYIQSVLPVNDNKLKRKNISPDFNFQTAKLNQKLRDLCDNFNLIYIDYWPVLVKKKELISEYTFDGIHLTGEAYLLIKSILKEHIS